VKTTLSKRQWEFVGKQAGWMKTAIGFNEPRRIRLGRTVATPGAIQSLKDANQNAIEFLKRHVVCDWGEVPDGDKELNDEAVDTGGRVLSAYTLKNGEKIWIITESDRSVTTILLPSEY
jgi:hypothetical protein